MVSLLLAALALTAQHQHVPGMHHPSGYAGLETRELRAYSDEQLRALVGGEGMGYALVAELNHYPGPKHVLELATQLELSDEQMRRTELVFDRMHRRAVRLGQEIVEKQRQLQELFVEGEAELARDLTVVIGELEGELRWVHLDAHVQMHRLLTPDQVQRYDQLRGYE